VSCWQPKFPTSREGLRHVTGRIVTIAYLSFLVGVVLVAAIGLFVYARTPIQAAWLQDLLGRLGRIRDACVDQLGRYGGAVAVLLATSAAAVVVCWPFGRFARRFEPQIDAPFLRWTQRHVKSHGSWYHLNSILTHMGNRPQIKIISLVAAVVFAALWARRGWWIPPLIIAAALGFEKFGQSVLAKVVDRPSPGLPRFGTYPSGGCARLVVTYGIIFYLILLTWPSISRRWRVAGFTAIAILSWVEGYTRIYLIKHWGMDVVGGWLYGTLLLLALIAAASCFMPRVEVPEQVTVVELVDAGGSPS
jgi:membrane-associated phospholipid phosphatase